MGNLAESPFLKMVNHINSDKDTGNQKSISEFRANKNSINKVKIMVDKRLELVFIDKDGQWYPLDEVDREDLAQGLEKISKEVAKRLQLLKEQR